MDVVEALLRVSARSQGLATADQLRRAGVSKQALARAAARGEVVRVRRQVYAASPLPGRPAWLVTAAGPAPEHVLHARAVLLSLGPSAAACGRTAAALRGWGLLREPTAVDVALPHAHGHTAARGVRVVRRRRTRVEGVPVLGGAPLALTCAVDTVVDLALELPLLEAVVACDSALRAGDVTLTDLRGELGRQAGRRGAARLGQVLDLCDPECGSVLESVLRVRMVLDGITGFATQVVLRDAAGRHLLRADFCFARQGLVVETDGARWHPDGALDRRTDNALAALGWRVLRYSWREVVERPAPVLRQIRAAAATGGTHRDLSPLMAA